MLLWFLLKIDSLYLLKLPGLSEKVWLYDH